jgi:hypothetical protein
MTRGGPSSGRGGCRARSTTTRSTLTELRRWRSCRARPARARRR